MCVGRRRQRKRAKCVREMKKIKRKEADLTLTGSVYVCMCILSCGSGLAALRPDD